MSFQAEVGVAMQVMRAFVHGAVSVFWGQFYLFVHISVGHVHGLHVIVQQLETDTEQRESQPAERIAAVTPAGQTWKLQGLFYLFYEV